MDKLNGITIHFRIESSRRRVSGRSPCSKRLERGGVTVHYVVVNKKTGLAEGNADYITAHPERHEGRMGAAVCSIRDQYCRKAGRLLAMRRARTRRKLYSRQATTEVFNTYQDLVRIAYAMAGQLFFEHVHQKLERAGLSDFADNDYSLVGPTLGSPV